MHSLLLLLCCCTACMLLQQHIPICRMGVEYCSPFLLASHLASHPVLSADLLFCCSCRHLLSVWDSCDTTSWWMQSSVYSAIRYLFYSLFYSTTWTLYPLWIPVVPVGGYLVPVGGYLVPRTTSWVWVPYGVYIYTRARAKACSWLVPETPNPGIHLFSPPPQGPLGG